MKFFNKLCKLSLLDNAMQGDFFPHFFGLLHHFAKNILTSLFYKHSVLRLINNTQQSVFVKTQIHV